MLHFTLIRTGKPAQNVTIDSAKTVEAILQDAGFTAAQYQSWTVKDSSTGDNLAFDDVLDRSMSLIVGAPVAGA